MWIARRVVSGTLVLIGLCSQGWAQERFKLAATQAADQAGRKEGAAADCSKPQEDTALAWHRAGVCSYEQARAANALAFQANQQLIRFVEACNQTLSCEENGPRIDEMKAELEARQADVRLKLSASAEALARSVATKSTGDEGAEARQLLELINKVLALGRFISVAPDEVMAPIILRYGE